MEDFYFHVFFVFLFQSMHHSQIMPGCSAPLVVKFADSQRDKEQRKILQTGLAGTGIGIGGGVGVDTGVGDGGIPVSAGSNLQGAAGGNAAASAAVAAAVAPILQSVAKASGVNQILSNGLSTIPPMYMNSVATNPMMMAAAAQHLLGGGGSSNVGGGVGGGTVNSRGPMAANGGDGGGSTYPHQMATATGFEPILGAAAAAAAAANTTPTNLNAMQFFRQMQAFGGLPSAVTAAASATHPYIGSGECCCSCKVL